MKEKYPIHAITPKEHKKIEKKRIKKQEKKEKDDNVDNVDKKEEENEKDEKNEFKDPWEDPKYQSIIKQLKTKKKIKDKPDDLESNREMEYYLYKSKERNKCQSTLNKL